MNFTKAKTDTLGESYLLGNSKEETRLWNKEKGRSVCENTFRNE